MSWRRDTRFQRRDTMFLRRDTMFLRRERDARPLGMRCKVVFHAFPGRGTRCKAPGKRCKPRGKQFHPRENDARAREKASRCRGMMFMPPNTMFRLPETRCKVGANAIPGAWNAMQGRRNAMPRLAELTTHEGLTRSHPRASGDLAQRRFNYLRCEAAATAQACLRSVPPRMRGVWTASHRLADRPKRPLSASVGFARIRGAAGRGE